MPLFVNGEKVEKVPPSVTQFLTQFPHFEETSEALKSRPTKKVGPEGLLYVGQREMGATTPSDPSISIIGSSDATTCHIAVLRHSASGVTCLAHLDGSNTKDHLRSLVDKACFLSSAKTDQPGRLELHLAGGFQDSRGHSTKLSLDIIKTLMEMKEDIHLLTACITDHNTEMKNGLPYPVIYGLGVDVKTGEIFNAEFPEKGPDHPIRSARHFTGGDDLIDIYDHKNQQMTIGPFDYRALDRLDLYLQLPDAMIRKYLSTSPEQEPPHFEATVRAALEQMRDHPEPAKTVFRDSQPRRYQLQPNGSWQRIE